MAMKKVVINDCFGGFGLSDQALTRYNEQTTGKPVNHYSEISREDLTLIQVIEELGMAANDEYSLLKIIEIPKDISYSIEEYDGTEWIAETHKTWH